MTEIKLILLRLPDINDALAVGDNLPLVALVVGHTVTGSATLGAPIEQTRQLGEVADGDPPAAGRKGPHTSHPRDGWRGTE